jgi:outer membrane protein
MNRFSFRRVPTLLLFLPIIAVSVHAQQPDLTLEEVLYESISNNLSLKVTSYDRYLSEQDVQIENSVFDSTVFGEANMTKEEQDYNLSRSESQRTSMGIRKRFSTGANVTLQTNYLRNDGSRFDTSLNQVTGGNLSHTMGISLSIRQPLLKGFGRSANKAKIWKAESQLEVSKLEYRNWVLDIVNQSEKSYWNNAFQNARLELSKSSVEVAKSLLDETEQRAEVGLATRLDVLQAKANLATQQESFIDAQRSVQDAADQLLTNMGRLTPDYQETAFTVSALPELDSEMPKLMQSWAGALQTDLNTRIQRTNIESLEYDKILAKDSLKTELDLVLSGSSKGLSSEKANDAISGALERKGHDWGIGIEVSVPIGKRSSKASLNKIEAYIEREKVRLNLIEQALFQDVRSQWRSLLVSLEKLRATRTTVELEEQTFEQAQVKYSNGLAVFRDVEEAQDSLNRARIAELNAWFSAITAEADLSRLDGSILERLNINIDFE